MNKSANYKFTIIVPVYNEEDNIYALEEKTRQVLTTIYLSGMCTFCKRRIER